MTLSEYREHYEEQPPRQCYEYSFNIAEDDDGLNIIRGIFAFSDEEARAIVRKENNNPNRIEVITKWKVND